MPRVKTVFALNIDGSIYEFASQNIAAQFYKTNQATVHANMIRQNKGRAFRTYEGIVKPRFFDDVQEAMRVGNEICSSEPRLVVPPFDDKYLQYLNERKIYLRELREGGASNYECYRRLYHEDPIYRRKVLDGRKQNYSKHKQDD